MKSAVRPAHAGFRGRQIGVLATLPLVALALLLPPTGIAAVPHALQPPGATVAAQRFSSGVSSSSSACRIELAGNKRNSDDDNFDPYGKDDPTNRKWGAAAGLGGNRFGGLNTRGDAKNKGQKAERKNSDRDDREPREPRPPREDADRN